MQVYTGEMIQNARKAKGWSQACLANALRPLGIHVTNQGISKWEQSITQPNAEQLAALCVVLGIDDMLGEMTNGVYGVYARLNHAGRVKLNEYRQLLQESGKFAVIPASKTTLRRLPLYSLAVSAGTGQFLDGENYEMVEVSDDVPMEANFAVRIAGDSMEPKFLDGQIIWVQQQQTLMTGQYGIFLYDGCAYLKQLMPGDGTMLLHSLNPQYEDIVISPMLQLRVLGRVLEK